MRAQLMTYEERPPYSCGVGMMLFGGGGIVLGLFFIGFAVYGGSTIAPVTATGWADFILTLVIIVMLLGFGLVLAAVAPVMLVEGIADFRVWRAAPNRRSLWWHFKEFFRDLGDAETASSPAVSAEWPAGNSRRIDLTQLPPDLADAVRPFLPGGTRYVTRKEFDVLLAEAIRLLRQRAAFTAQARAALNRQTELDLAQARAGYVAGLSEAERAIFAAMQGKWNERI